VPYWAVVDSSSRPHPFLERVLVRNYKSIAACDVWLKPLNFFVGPNGSGKSNFLDAINFVADALSTSLDHALRIRGGINDVRRRSHGRPNHFAIRLEFNLEDGTAGHYAFEIGATAGGGFEVREEQCAVRRAALDHAFFKVKRGEVQESSFGSRPAYSSDRLYLVRLSGEPEFRNLFDALTRMSFYNFNPGAIRDMQPADQGQLLRKDGSNVASVFSQIHDKTSVIDYLGAIVPGIENIVVRHLGGKETLEFAQRIESDGKPLHFLANSMSDGTLRVLAILVAIFQSEKGFLGNVTLTGLEEPEIALHPGAAGILFEVLRDASELRQVLVTSHSPDLLDNDQIDPHSLFAVEFREGASAIAPVDQVGIRAVRESLYTPGELLRLNQLVPDRESLQQTRKTIQEDLFHF